MRKKQDSEPEDDTPKQAAIHLLDRVPDPFPNESVLDYWRRVGPLATQATVIRALAGDHQASAAMFDMVTAPVIQEVTIAQHIGADGAATRSISAQMALLTDINSGKGSVTRRKR